MYLCFALVVYIHVYLLNLSCYNLLWQSRVETNMIPSCIFLIPSLHSKRCISVLPLRLGLISTAVESI